MIAAEGVGSSTRELVFPGENAPRWMDLTIAYLTIPRTPDDDRMWRWFNATGGRSISLRPDQHGTTRAMLTLRQVRMERWSSGRVVLTGDAARCATPLTGIGTTLAVTGACVMAGELTRTDTVATAFAAYERAMRPYVEKAQRVPKLAPKLMNPRTRTGIRLLHGTLNIASRPALRRVTAKLFDGRSEGPDLAAYFARSA